MTGSENLELQGLSADCRGKVKQKNHVWNKSMIPNSHHNPPGNRLVQGHSSLQTTRVSSQTAPHLCAAPFSPSVWNGDTVLPTNAGTCSSPAGCLAWNVYCVSSNTEQTNL